MRREICRRRMNLRAPRFRPMSGWNRMKAHGAAQISLGRPGRNRLAGAAMDAAYGGLRAGAARQNAEHMARARSLTRATAAPEPTHRAYGYAVLFGSIALLFQSRVPLYLGAFLFLTDGER